MIDRLAMNLARGRQRGGSAAWLAGGSALLSAFVPVAITEPPTPETRVMTPHGWPVPEPSVNALPSKLALASAKSMATCSAMSLSSYSSMLTGKNAAPFWQTIAGWLKVGESSLTSLASASQDATTDVAVISRYSFTADMRIDATDRMGSTTPTPERLI